MLDNRWCISIPGENKIPQKSTHRVIMVGQVLRYTSALVKKMKENEKNGKHFFSVYFKEHGNTYNCYPKEKIGREKTNHAVAARQRAAITSNSASSQLVWDCKAACSLLCHTQGSCGCTHPAGSPPGCYASRETAA